MSCRQQNTLSLFDRADFAEDRVKPESKRGEPRDTPAQTKETIREPLVSDLLERALAPQNMRAALKRVEQNKGAAGVDGMTAMELRPFLLTQRSAGISQAQRIKQINQYLGGWMGYFALSELPSLFQELDAWLRRRLRMCQ